MERELFTNRFVAVAREMGEQLRRTALSTNVKERLDFSCGVLDPAGELVVNAPHIPVHLGALGLCVRRVAESLDPAPGDVVVTNHPAFGGSHLPDVTVVTPVHAGDDPGSPRVGWVASRAHHAELGGRRPGSMPPDARSLAEEGVVIAPRQQRRMTVDMTPVERLQLGHRTGVAEDHARVVHELGQADHAGMIGRLRGHSEDHGHRS